MRRALATAGLLGFLACSAPAVGSLSSNGDEPDADAGPDGSTGSNDAEKNAQPPQKEIPAIDDAVKKFMTDHSLPGVSIAITKGEKLVYAKGYGQIGTSDTTPVTTASLFRIASLSKAFTSAAIMRLIEEGKLTMSSKVFGAAGIFGADYSSANIAALSDITIDHLLHHTTGNWPNDGTDPMMKQPALSAHDLIQWTIDNYPDQNARGQFKYSNFGYCVLGRVIEKVSGKSYAEFVRDEIFTPAGITDMAIAGNTQADREPNEVIYNAGGVGDPYGLDVARMDSHGGWIATAVDLMRFVVRVDGFSAKPDLLQSATETVMTTPSASNANYACGWLVNAAPNWWHQGSLPGGVSEMVRANNGFNWAILTNGWDGHSTKLFQDMDALLWPAVDDPSTPWQDTDQF